MEKKNYNLPKILVISNNSLSDNNSNGRTLAGLLRKIPKECISQIYISGEIPQSTVCNRFFRMTDSDALNGIIKRKQIGGIIENKTDLTAASLQKNTTGKKKTILKMMLRDIVWSLASWFSKDIKSWIESFSPDVILFFAGESKFTFKIADKISKYYSLPIVAYNSEAYYFKDKNYLKGCLLSDLLYPIFHFSYKKQFIRTLKNAKHIVHLNDKLKDDFDKVLNISSSVIYTSTTIEFENEEKKENNPLIISYLGNLGLNRHKSLIEIASVITKIAPGYKVDVYGKIPNDVVENDFNQCNGIRYKGFVSYNEVITIMKNSDILIHTESFDEFYKWDLEYGFSTKIPDCLASGTCLFAYAPENISFVDYLKKYDCACVATKQNDLEELLKNLLNNPSLRSHYVENALKVAKENHNIDKNCEIMNEIIVNAVK